MQLAPRGRWENAYASVLLRVEAARTIDRIRLSGAVNDRQMTDLLTQAHGTFEAINFVSLSDAILRRASQSFPTALGTLDALHLATALRLAEAAAIQFTFLTHDAELARAAHSVNFRLRCQHAGE